jgi:hypothetical protein
VLVAGTISYRWAGEAIKPHEVGHSRVAPAEHTVNATSDGNSSDFSKLENVAIISAYTDFNDK